MKKKILITLFLFALTMAAGAQNAVVVYQMDGKVARFGFEEKPKVTYVNNELVLTTTKTTVQYPVYMLKKICFDIDGIIEGVGELKQPDTKFGFRDGQLTIQDGEPGSLVHIYNLGGMTIGQYRLDRQGNATIPMLGLGADLYVVKAKGFTFKFRKP